MISNIYLVPFCSIFSSMSLKICLNSKSPGNEFNKQCRSKELWENSSPQSILRNNNRKHVSYAKMKGKKPTSSCDTKPKTIIAIFGQNEIEQQENQGIIKRHRVFCYLNFMRCDLIFTLFYGLKAEQKSTPQRVLKHPAASHSNQRLQRKSQSIIDHCEQRWLQKEFNTFLPLLSIYWPGNYNLRIFSRISWPYLYVKKANHSPEWLQHPCQPKY